MINDLFQWILLCEVFNTDMYCKVSSAAVMSSPENVQSGASGAGAGLGSNNDENELEIQNQVGR